MALPWSVLDSASYAHLSHPARSLLLEFARQFVRDNNGRLLASRAYLKTRGWHSAAVIQRSKVELLAAGFIYETVKGARPNRAAWYAVTWRALDRHHDYDAGVTAGFVRGAYKNASLIPSGGTEKALIGPSGGTEKAPPVPSHGTIKASFAPSPVPSHGNHLEMPSAGSAGAVQAVGLPAVGAVQERAPPSEKLAPSTQALLEELQRRNQQRCGTAEGRHD